MKQKIDKNFFPGWVKKSIAFSIDDGYLPTDKKFVQIVKPAGIKGDFNLCADRLDRSKIEEYRTLYDGFAIANHVCYHPFCMDPDAKYDLCDEPFDESTADPEKIYPTQVAGLYHFHHVRGWRYIASSEGYVRFVKEGKEKLEEIFGTGTVRGFVWPFSVQKDKKLQPAIEKLGYTGMRNSSLIGDTTEFSLPENRMCWNLNAAHQDLVELGEKYEKYENPTGKLCFFGFGIHSVDYERAGTWNLLSEFADRFGNRPDTFYYSDIENIFDYEDAIAALDITGDVLKNDSDLDLFLTVDGKRTTLPRHSTLTLNP